MIFTDEKEMWYSETEKLAEKLSNKTQREIQEILDESDVIALRSIDRPKDNKILNRFVFILLFVPLLLLSAIKWIFTGDKYLDSWFKKYKMLDKLFKFINY